MEDLLKVWEGTGGDEIELEDEEEEWQDWEVEVSSEDLSIFSQAFNKPGSAALSLCFLEILSSSGDLEEKGHSLAFTKPNLSHLFLTLPSA